jgi:hypothetical protein
VDFEAAAVITVEVSVVGPDGKAPAWAQVSARSDDRSSQGRGTSTGHVSLTLETGAWKLTAKGGPHDTQQSETVELDLAPGLAPQQLTLTLIQQRALVLTVKPPRIGTRDTYRAYLETDLSQPPTADRSRAGQSVWLNKDRQYLAVFRDARPGHQRVVVTDEFYTMVQAWREVTMGEGLQEVEIAIPDPRREDHIVVRVYGPDGALLGDATARARVEARNLSTGTGAGYRAPDGSLWVRRASEEADSLEGPWWYELTASSPSHGSISARYESDATHDLEMRFQAAAHLVVTLAGWETHEYRDSIFVNLNQDARYHQVMVAKTGEAPKASAEWRFGPVQPGDHEVTMYLSTDGRRTTILHKQTVRLASGENGISISVPPLHNLTLVMPENGRISSVTLKRDEEHLHSLTASEFRDGRAVITGLLPGDYLLEGDHGGMRVNVPQQTEVVLNLRPYDCLVFVFVEAGSKAEELGFREGDKLFEVDGTLLDNVYAAQGIMFGAMSKERTTWAILRGGVRIEISIAGRQVSELFTQGAKLWPGFRDD